jgi:hypothetical protein
MNLILSTLVNGKMLHTDLGKLTALTLSSANATRMKLTVAAFEHFGREGKDWRIVNRPGWLVPFYVASALGDTITIE